MVKKQKHTFKIKKISNGLLVSRKLDGNYINETFGANDDEIKKIIFEEIKYSIPLVNSRFIEFDITFESETL